MEKEYIPYKRWLHQHDEDIRKDFPDRPTEDLADKYDINYYTVSRRATRMGIGKSAEFMHTSWKKGAKGARLRGDAHKRQLAAADKYMLAHFHDTSNADIARMFGVDVKTVRRWARRLGLQKSEEFMFSARSKAGNNRRYYTDEQLEWRKRRIAEVYPDGDEEQLRQLAEELGITRITLISMAQKNGVRRSPERVAEAVHRGWDKKRKYSREILKDLAAYYVNHSNQECAEKFGMSMGVINQIAVRNGWKKDREYISRLRSRLMRQRNLHTVS